MRRPPRRWKARLEAHFEDRPEDRFRRRLREGPPFGRRRRSGLRGRLTRSFALVAVLAVLLTTWLTVNAGVRVIGRLTVEGVSNARDFGPGWWDALPPETRERYQEAGRAAGRELGRSATLAFLLASVLAVTVAAGVTRRLTRPLARLADGAQRLGAGERGLRLPVPPGRDELRDLTVAFNTLGENLERQEAWRRALVADVAHDLRTPLAVLRAEIEAMQDGVQDTDETSLARLHGEVLLLARLVDDLRTLSLAEGGALSLRPEALDAGDLLADVAAAFGRRAREARAELSLRRPPGPLPVRADRDRLTQVLHNLLDNALRHAAPGRIELEASRDADRAVLRVRDHGPGLPPEALSRAFERFYRADASRTRDPSGRASSGLGLAIARALVEAQGGTIAARNPPDGGAEFTVTLPLRDEE